MKIQSKDLKEAMELVIPGLTSATDIEQGNSFIFKDNKLITYNNEVSISFPLKNDLDCVVESGALYSFISKIKECELDIKVVGGELLLKAGRSKIGIPINTNENAPVIEEIKKNKWISISKSFFDGLKFVKDGCGKDFSFPILNCIHINNKVMEASDGFKVITYKIKDKLEFEVLLPLAAALIVIKINPNFVYSNNGWLFFTSDNGLIISCRALKEDYPAIKDIMKVKGDTIIFPVVINEIIGKAEIFAKRERKEMETINIELTKSKFSLSSKGDSGWFKEEVKNDEYKGKEIKFTLPPYLLKDILKTSSSCIVNKNKIKFKGDNWSYVGLLKVTSND